MRFYNGGRNRNYRNRHGKVWYKRHGKSVLEGMIADGVNPLDAHHIAQWEELYGPSEERIAKAQAIYDQWYNDEAERLNETSFDEILGEFKDYQEPTVETFEEDGIPPEASVHQIVRAVRVIEEGRRFQRFREVMKEEDKKFEDKRKKVVI